MINIYEYTVHIPLIPNLKKNHMNMSECLSLKLPFLLNVYVDMYIVYTFE